MPPRTAAGETVCGRGGGTAPGSQRYTLPGADRRPYLSATPGAVGGHRKGKVYGRLNCPSALRAIAVGGYVTNRVFFASEPAAVAAGYRPCAVCMPDAYRTWTAASLLANQVMITRVSARYTARRAR